MRTAIEIAKRLKKAKAKEWMRTNGVQRFSMPDADRYFMVDYLWQPANYGIVPDPGPPPGCLDEGETKSPWRQAVIIHCPPELQDVSHIHRDTIGDIVSIWWMSPIWWGRDDAARGIPLLFRPDETEEIWLMVPVGTILPGPIEMV